MHVCLLCIAVISKEGYLRMLITILDGVATKWKEIGVVLNFSSGDLNAIEQTPTLIVKGPKGYFHELVRQWLEWTPPDHNLPTITTLYDALRDPLVNEPVLAEDLLVLAEDLLEKGII